jgi:hypothetical protein
MGQKTTDIRRIDQVAVKQGGMTWPLGTLCDPSAVTISRAAPFIITGNHDHGEGHTIRCHILQPAHAPVSHQPNAPEPDWEVPFAATALEVTPPGGCALVIVTAVTSTEMFLGSAGPFMLKVNP